MYIKSLISFVIQRKPYTDGSHMINLLSMSCFFVDGVAYDIMRKAKQSWMAALIWDFHNRQLQIRRYAL